MNKWITPVVYFVFLCFATSLMYIAYLCDKETVHQPVKTQQMQNDDDLAFLLLMGG